jgi:hypothetical protein
MLLAHFGTCMFNSQPWPAERVKGKIPTEDDLYWIADCVKIDLFYSFNTVLYHSTTLKHILNNAYLTAK